MGLETGTYVNDLNTANPLGTDAKNAGDDHLRLIKSTLKATFPGMAGAFARVQSKATGYTAVANDNTSLIDCSAALTLALTAAATLGNGWMIAVYARGGAVVVDPNSTEQINGAATLTIPSGSFALVWCTGTAFYAGVFLNGNAQPLDAELTALAGLTSAADRLPYFTGSGVAALATFTAQARALLDDTTAAAQMTTVGVGINSLTEDTSPDSANDLVATYDASAATVKKVKLQNIATPADGEFRSIQVFTSSGTWTKPAGLKRAKVTVVGGGGGGGGADNSNPGGGGGGGGCAIEIIEATSLGSTETVTVGASGTAGSNAGSTGGTGGTSSFGAHCSATGGVGGTGGSNPTDMTTQAGGGGGIGSGGTVNLKGGGGGNGFTSINGAELSNVYSSGCGGDSYLGGGGNSVGQSSAGAAGGAYGGGGSGGSALSSTGYAGGAGAAGIVIVEEFF